MTKTAKCKICEKRFRRHEWHSDYEWNVCFTCRTWSKWLIRHCSNLANAAWIIEGVRQGVEAKYLKKYFEEERAKVKLNKLEL